MKKILVTLIRIYQATLSAVIGPRCRFYPSCSAYSAEAIEMHGTVTGLRMSLVRVCKCHPFHAGGYDPVPSTVEPGTFEKGI